VQELLARAGGLGRAERLSLLHIDQAQRWRRGERLLVETYLARLPDLGADGEAVLDLIVHEILLREGQGEAPVPEEYLQRFPRFGAEILRHFEVCRALAAGVGLDLENLSSSLSATPAPRGTALDNTLVQTKVQDAKPPTPTGPPETVPGVRVAGYRILEKLGQGGMGVVYKAQQLGLDRLVALKMMLRTGDDAGSHELARFRSEAEVVARLQHPNIVQIYDIGELDGRPYFAMELVEGGSLAQKLQGATLPTREAGQLVATLARAVQVAHQRDIIHRDLKPANVLLTADGTPKIADFGLAKRLDLPSGQTVSGAVMGTPQYMAPEQASGKSHKIGPAADVYALGAVLYDVLTGHPPFQGDTPYDTLSQVISREPLPPSRVQPKVSRDLETICLKCLEKEPRRRYASALALATDLECFLAGEPIRARRASVWERGVKWARRRPAVAALTGLLTAVVAAGALGLVLMVFWHVRTLNDEVARAQAEEKATQEKLQAQERATQEKLQEARRREELAAQRAESETLLQRGRAALREQRWPDAKVAVSSAQTRLANEPALQPLREEARRLQEEVRHWEDAARALERLRQLKKAGGEVLFQLTLLPYFNRRADPARSEKWAREALAGFGIEVATATPPDLPDKLSARQKGQILEACYELLLLQAEAAAQQGAADRALAVLKRASQLRPPTPAYHLRRARYLERLHNLREAEAARAEAQRQPPATPGDRFLLGDELLQQGDPTQAASYFDQVLRDEPGHFGALYLLAVCDWQASPRRLAEAKRSLTSCLEQHKEFAWIYLLRGLTCLELREFGAALKDFEDAEELMRQHPDPSAAYSLRINRAVLRVRQAQALDQVAFSPLPGLPDTYQVCRSLARDGYLAEAARELRQAIHDKPNEYQAYQNLAQLFWAQKRFPEAIRELDNARQVEPREARLYRERALMEWECNDREKAFADLDEALRLEPRGGEDWAADRVRQGLFLFQQGKYAAAVDALDDVLRARPGYAAAHYARGQALLALHNYPRAVEAFNRFVQLGKRPPKDLYYRRGLARDELGDKLGAVADYTKALELAPGPAVHVARGWVYLLNGSPNLALPDFEAALRGDPNHADAYNGRGYARVQLGQYREAVLDAEQACRCGPPAPSREYKAARIFAQAVAKIEADPARQNSAGWLARFEYQARALELIRRALEQFPPRERPAFWQGTVARDAALQPIRRDPGFRRLEEEFAGPRGTAALAPPAEAAGLSPPAGRPAR
jgi:tetratricopeptide (TPR) repeat protein